MVLIEYKPCRCTCQDAQQNIRPIRHKRDLDSALERIDELIDAEQGTSKSDELEVLTQLVEHYERKHVPMDFPSAIDAIEFYIDQQKLKPRDLVPLIGSPARVSEVLSGRRPLTMPMARALHEHLGIPAELLLNESPTTVEWRRFPLKAMGKLGWIEDRTYHKEEYEEVIRNLIVRAGRTSADESGLFKKNHIARSNAKMDVDATKAWCWQVLAKANENPPNSEY